MGPALSGKNRVAFELLANAYDRKARPCVVTATDTASQFRKRFEPYVRSDHHVEDVLVIDALAGASDDTTRTGRTFTVGTPADLTGIGVQLSKALERLPPTERQGARVLVDSLSTLLIYSDIKRLFRFVNAINRRINGVGSGTVHVLDDDAIESQHRQQLLQLFPTVVQVEEEAGETKFRIRGERTSDWYAHATSQQS
jgi:KaiC/GvpD/RAD55 family RecA-like ATPase